MKQRKQVQQKNSRRSTRVAAATLLAACAASGAAKAQVAAQPAVNTRATEATLPVSANQFSIPAGSLADALASYSRQTQVKINFGVAQSVAGDFRTSGVSGQFSNADALTRLLDGTGLTATFTSASNVSVGLRNSERVEVSSTLPDGVAINKFSQPLIDTPETIAVVPKFVTDDEGVTTLRDSLRNVPGVSLAAGEAGAQGDNLTIRGFTARNDIYLDGIRDYGSYYRDSFNYEQIEVLEGPAGVAFGRGSTGGVVNQESKVPQATPHVGVSTQFGTNLERRLAVDINEPLPQLANGSAVRLNAFVDESGVAGRPFAALRRYGLAPSITFGLNSPTRFTLSYFHLTESDTPDYGLPWFYSRLAPGVSRNAYFGFGDENYLKTSDDIITARLDHDFRSNIVLHSIARAANYPRSAQITEPQICTNPSLSVPVGGYVSARPTSSVTGATCPYVFGAADPASILVNRNQIQVKSVEGDLWDQTELALRFKTFGLRHELTVGIEGGQEISNPIRYLYAIKGATGPSLNTVPSTTLLNPNTAQVFGGTGYASTVTHAKAETVATYFVDTIHLGRRVDLTGGVRFDRFDSGFNQYAPTPPAGGTVQATCPVGAGASCATSVGSFSRVDEQPTYRAALVVRTNPKGSVYFDYGTSFNPSAETLALSSITQNVAPEENETYEVGAKQSFMNDRLMVEGAVFRTEKDNARETDPTNSLNIVVAGNQRVKGLQVSAVGRLPQGLDLIAGYAYLDSAVIYSKFYPTSVGFPLANVPKQTFNLFFTHMLPLRFSGGLGGNYVASRTASSTTPFVPTNYGPAQTFAAGSAPCATAASPTVTTCYQVTATAFKQVPGYWVFNAMLRRPLSDHVDLQANVNNLLNRFYIDQPHPSHLIPGEGLNALIGMNFKF